MATVMSIYRTRNHRSTILKGIEAGILKLRHWQQAEEDIFLWRIGDNQYSKHFSIKQTSTLLRPNHTKQPWCRGVWFSYATLKYAFLTWLAIHNRLATGDRMRNWNLGMRTDCMGTSRRNSGPSFLLMSIHRSCLEDPHIESSSGVLYHWLESIDNALAQLTLW